MGWHAAAAAGLQSGMSAAWAWLVLVLGIAVFVTVFDVLAIVHHRATMSAQFHAWLYDPAVGPFILGAFAGVFVGLLYHLFTTR